MSKFLFIINIDMGQNGPSVHLLTDIINETRSRGHEIVRVERRYNTSSWCVSKEKNEFGDLIYRVETLPPNKRNYFFRYLDDIKYACICKKIFVNESFYKVFIQSCNTAGFHAYWINRRLKCPFVLNVQDIFPLDIYFENILSKRNIAFLFFQKEQLYAYKTAQRIITISEDMKDTLGKMIRYDKIDVIYNWEYKTTWSDAENNVIKEKLFKNNKFNVVYAGNIGNAQGVDILIKTSKLLETYKNIEVIIIGNGSCCEKCIKLATKLCVKNIRFEKKLPQNFAPYIYWNADINVITLAAGIMNTSFPSKTAGCIKSGRPLIYCIEQESKAIRKLIEKNTNVFQCDPGDAEKLAALILYIYNNSYNRNKSGKMLIPSSPKNYVDLLEK